MSTYIHNVPGRMRVKIPHMKRNQSSAEELQRILNQIEGIDSTAVNTLTGSIVINYDSRLIGPNRILNALKDKGYVDPSKAMMTNDDVIESAVSKAGGVLGKALLGLLVEKTFEGSALSLLTVLI
ncbi:MAG: heavy-metal-associated domain-containing protein [Syntrophobacteraceae bacterium]|nr:heavy-metal-associated domain-containing protein [Syntrophobacteraceae bacterium]